MASAAAASRSIYLPGKTGSGGSHPSSLPCTDTYILSIATVAPKLPVELHEVAAALRSRNAQLTHADYVIRLYALRTRRRGYEVIGMKSMMDLIGLAEGRARPPLSDLRPDEVDDVHRLVAKWKTVL